MHPSESPAWKGLYTDAISETNSKKVALKLILPETRLLFA
jgi:hypothetical protein